MNPTRKPLASRRVQPRLTRKMTRSELMLTQRNKKVYDFAQRAVTNILAPSISSAPKGKKLSPLEMRMIFDKKVHPQQVMLQIAAKIPKNRRDRIKGYHEFLHTNQNFENLIQGFAVLGMSEKMKAGEKRR